MMSFMIKFRIILRGWINVSARYMHFMLVTYFAKIFPFTTQLRKFGLKRQEVTGQNTAQKLFHLHAEQPIACDPIEHGRYAAFCTAKHRQS